MLKATPEAAAAMTATPRRVLARAKLDVIDPDIVYQDNETSESAPYANVSQLSNRITDSALVCTFEPGHWPLDGSCIVSGLSPMETEVGFVAAPLGDADGVMSGVFAQINITGLDVLSLCSIHFSQHEVDGYAVNLRVDIMSGLTTAYSREITDNRSTSVVLSGFTAYNVTAIRVTPTLWSRPHTRARIIEIMPGLYEVWEGASLFSTETYKEADFSMITLPYGTATLEVDNADKRYNPRDESSILRMIESRQAIPIENGVALENGAIEWFPAGTYYQQNLGWQTDTEKPLIKFSLVDIIGLLRDRKYRPPLALPKIFGDWIASIVAQLGTNFADKYYVDETLADFPLTATQDNVQSITCGELLRLACMAAGAVCYADTTTGFLFATAPITATGTVITRDNLSRRAGAQANLDIASVVFQLADGNNTQLVINGTSTSADLTLSINNFFIHDQAAAQIVARRIIGHYGGTRYETVGRGDLRSELGDFDTIEVEPGDIVGARRTKQKLSIDNNGLLYDATGSFVQATGEDLFSTTVVITQSGQWQAPPGVGRIRLTLISGGYGGTAGSAGTGGIGGGDWRGRGGEGGAAGLVWTNAIYINDQQIFDVTIGQGGAPGTQQGLTQPPQAGFPGTPTLFGPYSSAEGTQYDGMVDITTGTVFASRGKRGSENNVAALPAVPPINGLGNGGNGGSGGISAIVNVDEDHHMEVIRPAGDGGPGGLGGTGCVIISYDLPEV